MFCDPIITEEIMFVNYNLTINDKILAFIVEGRGQSIKENGYVYWTDYLV